LPRPDPQLGCDPKNPKHYKVFKFPDEWFDFLEERDSATKIRKKMTEPKKPQQGSNPAEIAEWVAKRHMGADGANHAVWFLWASVDFAHSQSLRGSRRVHVTARLDQRKKGTFIKLMNVPKKQSGRQDGF
jgi:hypothetical protein